MLVFLALNGADTNVFSFYSDEKVKNFVLDVAKGEIGEKEIKEFIKENFL